MFSIATIKNHHKFRGVRQQTYSLTVLEVRVSLDSRQRVGRAKTLLEATEEKSRF